MLLPCVHVPAAYDDPAQIAANPDLYCSVVISILRDSLTNCILLVDDNNVVTKDMFHAVRSWPQKYEVRGLALLTALRQKNRFVKVSALTTVASVCERESCQYAIAIADRQSPTMLLCCDSCSTCPAIRKPSMATIVPRTYQVSSFAEARRQSESIELADGQWDKTTFQNFVLDPVFTSAKHVKIIDRMIGEHLTDQLVRRQTPIFRAAYANSLEWLFSRFLTQTANRPARSFEIICGVDERRLTTADMSKAAVVIREFAANLSARYSFPLEMHVKIESYSKELRHSRFLFTNQVALQFERGFDLLKADGNVRDIVINHIPESSANTIEREARALPDVPTELT